MNLLDLFDLFAPWGTAPLSVFEQCLQAVQTQIRALKLPGVSDDSVVVRSVPSAREFIVDGALALPAVVISPFGREQVESLAATNRTDTISYPVLVTMIAADNRRAQDRRSLYLTWREYVSRAFRHQRLEGVGRVLTCLIEPEPVVAVDAWQRNVWQSAIVLRFLARESRGS